MRAQLLGAVVHECADGGKLYEIYKEEGWGQLAIRTVPPGVTAGGHKHPLTNEYFLVFRGRATLYLERDGIREMRQLSEDKPQIVPVPAGTGHDIKNCGDAEMAFLFYADRVYRPETHDKEAWSWED